MIIKVGVHKADGTYAVEEREVGDDYFAAVPEVMPSDAERLDALESAVLAMLGGGTDV